MKWIAKKTAKASIILSTIALPTILTTSCSATYDTNHIVSTYYNSYDMLTALGIIPYGQTVAYQARKLNYFPYLENYINPVKTRFGWFTNTTSEPNMKALLELQTDTLVINEWDRPNEQTYKNSGFINHIAYTSMADSENALYKETKSMPWHEYSKGGLYNYRNAFTMLANDLDKRFEVNPNKLEYQSTNYTSYLDRANYIIDSDKKVIENLRNQVQATKLKDWNIGIFAGQEGMGAATPVENIKAIYDPFIYPEMYGPSGIGMGIQFPKPNENENTKTLKFAGDGISLASIQSKDDGVLKKSFEKKFDKIIFVKSPDDLYQTTQININNQLNQLKDYLKVESNQDISLIHQKDNNIQTTNNKDIVVVEWDNWYPTTWGVIGKTHVIKQMVDCFNILLENDSTSDNKKIEFPTNLLWEPYKKEQLIMPNKKINMQL